MSLKPHFSRFLGAHPQRLNFCAHCHHPWPDVTFEAQQRAWSDGAEDLEARWPRLFAERIPTAQHHLARLLNLPDPTTICVGGSTHGFLARLLSSLEVTPFRVLTTDGESREFTRQIRRLAEAGRCTVDTVALEPFDSFPARFADAARTGGHHLVHFSQVCHRSGYWIEDLSALVTAVPSPRSLVVVDGSLGFMAVPTDLSRIAARAFYLAAANRHAMAGDGLAFLHCPPGAWPRPLLTGGLAGFGAPERETAGPVPYPADGGRFLGGGFDPGALYRLNAVMDWVRRYQVTVQGLYTQVSDLQREFLEGLDRLGHPVLNRQTLLPPGSLRRGSFLCFRHEAAQAAERMLAGCGVLTEAFGDRLQFGFGLYHDMSDVAALLRHLDQSGTNERSRV